MNDYFDDYDEDDFMDDDCQSDEYDGVDDDFGKTSNHAEPNNDDVPDGFDWGDFSLGMGLGYELGYGERRRKRRDDEDF
jgi:hypothetical protein